MSNSKNVGSAFLMSVGLFFFLSLTGVGNSVGFLGSLLLSQFAILGPVIACLILVKKKPAEQLTLKKMKIVDIGLCILYYVCVRYVLEFVNMVSLLYSDNVTSGNIIQLAEQIPFWLCALVIAVLPAVSEELMFRGLIFTEFKKTSPLWAVLLSAGLFGILHGNLNQFTYTIMAGFLLVVLVVATGSLFSSIIVHCLINLRSVVILYALPFLAEKMEMTAEEVSQLVGSSKPDMEQILAEIPRAAVNAACAGICGFLIVRYLAKRNNRTAEFKGLFRKKAVGSEMIPLQEGVFTIPLLVGIFLAITYMTLTELSIRGLLK